MVGVPDSDELNRMMVEIGAGWEWGDPRSKVPQTPEHEASWGRLKVQMREIADQGGIVEIPGEFPDLSDYKPGVAGTVGRKKPTPERRPSRNESEEPKEQAKSSDPDQVKRTYLGKEEIDGTVSALYMMERGPGYLIDRVLHADGWVATLTLTDWRIGERSDIDIITPTVAKKTAEEWGLGHFIKSDNPQSPDNGRDTTRGSVGERFTAAVGFARKMHHGDVRKGTDIPYLSHLLAVSSLAIEDAAEDPLLAEQLEDIAIAAVLHDVVEDTVDKERKVTVEEVRKRFGDLVARIVEGCTDAQIFPKPEWEKRKKAYIKHLGTADQNVLCVALADKRHNARCIVNDATRLGPGFWKRFNAGPKEQIWYYSEVTKVLLERRPGAAAEELRRTVEQLCDLAERASTRKAPE